MNKQELIEAIQKESTFERIDDKIVNIIRPNEVFVLIDQLDEPEKVKIPQFVADWVEVCKEKSAIGLHTAMNPDFLKQWNKSDELISWIRIMNNQNIFARAWLDGYEIEKPKYVVTDGNHLYFKKYQEDIEIVILVDEQPGTMAYVKKFDTKKEAQKVADVLGWKVEEVK